MGVFKSYDIRGIYPTEWNKATAYRIGYFLPRLLTAETILVGRDCRSSSDEIFEALTSGITDAGANVCDAGQTTTPMVYFATSFYKFDGSVQITASHNPKEYNGLKISRRYSIPVGYDTGLQELESLVVGPGPTPKLKKGMMQTIDFRDDYEQFMKRFLPSMPDNITIAIDFSNGMASLFSNTLFKSVKNKLFDSPDGTFPNHAPNPLEHENLRDIIALTKKSAADCGIIFDGDADRVMFIDDEGNFIQPDYIIALLADFFAHRKPFTVLYDIRTSKSVDIYLKSLGATTSMWKVGHAFAKNKLLEIDGIFGGELAGHYYYKDFFFCDSGILTSLIMIIIASNLKKQGSSLSQKIKSIIKFSNSGERNFTIRDKQGAIDAVVARYTKEQKPTAVYDFDGYRIEFPDWWFNIRLSNTEPYLRLIVEANDNALLAGKLDEITAILKPFG